MGFLTNEEQDTLLDIFSGKGERNCFEVMSWDWALNTVGFNEIPAGIFEKLDIANQPSLNGKYTAENLLDSELECGFHIYWDKVPMDKISIGMYTEGGGDFELNFGPKDIFDKDHYDRLLNFGLSKIDEYEKGKEIE